MHLVIIEDTGADEGLNFHCVHNVIAVQAKNIYYHVIAIDLAYESFFNPLED